MKSPIIEKHPWLTGFIKFGIVGLSNTVIAWLTYYALTYFFGVHYLVASVISFIVSVINAYLWNSFWVFKDSARNNYTLPKFLIIYMGTLVFGIAFAYFLVDMLGVNQYLVPPLSLCITVPVNFILNKLWAFK